jgi:hypothetical protein
MDISEPVASRGVDEPPVVVEEERKANKSRLLDVGFGWVDVVGRGVEASVGGFEDTERSVNKSLVVG